MIKQTGPVFTEALENLHEASHCGFGSPDRPIGQVSLDAWGERDIEDSRSVERVNDHIHQDEAPRVSTGIMRVWPPRPSLSCMCLWPVCLHSKWKADGMGYFFPS